MESSSGSRPLIVCVLPAQLDHIEVIRYLLVQLDVTLKFFSRESDVLSLISSGEIEPQVLMIGSSLSRGDAQATIDRFKAASAHLNLVRIWMTSSTCMDLLQEKNRTEVFFDRLKLTDREKDESIFYKLVNETLLGLMQVKELANRSNYSSPMQLDYREASRTRS